jgi:glycosyltransferase involved in cell wall biosynthesis
MITVVVPACDEAGTIGATVGSIRAALAAPASDAEVLVVDDGSSDATGALAAAGGARVLRHAQTLGYGRSIKDGVAAARFDTIVICDGDGTYDIAAIPALLDRFGAGFDMVVAARRRPAGWSQRESRLKLAGRWALRALVEFTTGQRIPDVNSGLRVFTRSKMTPHAPFLSDGFSFTTSITVCFLMTRLAVSYLPADYRPRRRGSKVRLVRDSLRTLQGVTQVLLVYNPLKIFLLVVGAIAAVGVGCLVAGGLGWTPGATLALISLLTALVVLGFGFAATLLASLLAPRP